MRSWLIASGFALSVSLGAGVGGGCASSAHVYDLFITGSACSADPAFTSTGTGNKTIVVWCDDSCNGDNDDLTANVEVRWVSGSSCTPWTQNVYGKQC